MYLDRRVDDLSGNIVDLHVSPSPRFSANSAVINFYTARGRNEIWRDNGTRLLSADFRLVFPGPAGVFSGSVAALKRQGTQAGSSWFRDD